MTTKYKRFAITLNDDNRQKLESFCQKNGLTKSQAIARLLNRKPIVIDQKKLLIAIRNLESINRQLTGIAINLNQYEHQINKAMLNGQFDENKARLLQGTWDLMTEAKMKQKIDKLEKELSEYVNY